MPKTTKPKDFPAEDIAYMRRALELAHRGAGRTSPNPMVGAVIVRGGHVIGEGYHAQLGAPHAEVEAITKTAGDISGATLYVTLEPCCHYGKTPPCAPILVERGFTRVVAATDDPNPLVAGKGFSILRDAGIRVDVGVCANEAMRLNEAFFTFHALQRPFVICKWAMTMDGRIATDTGNSRWVSNEESRQYVHMIRSRVDAIMIGVGTVLLDNPRLNVRLEGYGGKQPLRIIADGHLRIPLRAKCLTGEHPERAVVATTTAAPKDKIARLRDAGHTVLVFESRRGLLDMGLFAHELHRMGIQSVLCEGGSSLNGALFDAGVVDKLIAFVAPKLIGGNSSKGPITGWGIGSMEEAVPMSDIAWRNFGNDLCFEGYVFGLFGTKKPDKRVAGETMPPPGTGA